jgi:HK97 family phage prohead protease
MSETTIETPDTEARESGLLRREYATELSPGDGRTIDVRIVPYGEKITHDDGHGGVAKGIPYTEEWKYGAFADQVRAAEVGRAKKVYVNFEHRQDLQSLIGHGLTLRESADGFYGSFALHENADGDKALMLVREGVLDGISLEVPSRTLKSVRTAAGIVQRVKAHLNGIALCRFPAFQNSRVLAIREEAEIIDEIESSAPDPELIERCRRLGIRIPQRYEAHPETDGHPDKVGTPGDGNRQPTTTSSEGATPE